ncbi:MAG: hypothetical protein QE263_01895 [Vampirovibrionales bacterium]|nr:hypothetical protein [Vampirovibrionales bacterium]
MLQLDWSAATPAAIGATHGFDPTHLSEKYAQPLAQAVEQLVANATKTGAWSRWLTLGNQPQLVAAINAYAASVKGKYQDVVLVGIGGSSLGPKALFQALRHPQWNLLSKEARGGYPRFHVVDHMDTDCLEGLWDILTPAETLFVVVSKSGTTIEPMSAMLDMMARYQAAGVDWTKHMVMVTDPVKGLFRPFAQQHNLPTFEVPDDVGGRFSVFCAVGLLPAALVGIDIAELLAGIQAIYPTVTNPDWTKNPAAQGAAVLVEAMGCGKPIHVFMPYSRQLALVADWFTQLWAESLGKATNLKGETVHVGPTPTKAVGPEDQHSQLQLLTEGPNDKVIVFVDVEKTAHTITLPTVNDDFAPMKYLTGATIHHVQAEELIGTRGSLKDSQRPTMTYTLPAVTPANVAQLLFTLEVQTALAGSLLGIDPFDQPGVEAGKKITQQNLAARQLQPV